MSKAAAPPVEPLASPWDHAFEALVAEARERVAICAPYVSADGASTALSALNRSGSAPPAALILTDLSPMAICMGATDPAAVASFQSGHANTRIVHLPRLHAKVYAADGATAIVTSGNLTGGGLRFNHEYGVLIRDPVVAGRIHADIDSLSILGAELDRAALQTFCGLAEEARDAYRAQMAAASGATVRRLRHALTVATDSLLHARLAAGPLHSVFATTIEHLLSRHGPMTTQQLHPLIQQMHPDLCDDSVDRVIDGKRFGKKWKHAVRTAQQQLKKRGVIRLLDDRWMVTLS